MERWTASWYSASMAVRLASSSSRLGTTMTSKPGEILLRRKTSRINRLALLRLVAAPSFLVAAIPSLVGDDLSVAGRRNSVKSLP